jgi:uncharacterized MnhB-related membrane protein
MALLVFQPVIGMLHHTLFKRYNRRVFWSYCHVWLGRIIITLGIINGGLGLLFAMQYPLLPPSRGAIIGYSVGAGVMWLFYLFSIIIGEGRRRRASDPVLYKEEYDSSSRSRGSRSRGSRGSRGSGSGGARSSRSHGNARGSRYSKSEERRRYA